MAINDRFKMHAVWIGITIGLPLLVSTGVQAQSGGTLEEIIVTAQRREQSLQEVPISIQTVTSTDILRQGFREMEDIEQFVPSVEIEANLHDTSITIRGMGNDVANMSIEQSAPMFVDGVTFGRGSMIDIAFLDVERVEVLMGPQPIHFGQNATAGAFSITTKKPTPVWEGDITTEIGNFARFSVEGGVGGPINDKWGIRLAGQWDQTKGHNIDMFTGDPYPHQRDAVGRVLLQWRPADNFRALFKVDYMNREKEGDSGSICRTEGPLKYDETAIIQRGLVPQWDAIHGADQGLERQLPNCVDGISRVGSKAGTESRLRNIAGINSSDGRSGTIDIHDLVKPFMAQVGVPSLSTEAREPLEVWNFLINLAYEFGNGIQIDSNSAMIDYHRETYEDNETDPFYNDSSSRVEQFDMWSQEIRVSSPTGGRIEWETGAYYQTESLDLNPVLTFRPNLRQPIRLYHPWQDPEWMSVFGALTFNFLGDKASLDVGGRFTDVHKVGEITAEGATYIFDIDPDGPTDPNPAVGVMTATEHRLPEDGGDRSRTLRFSADATPGSTSQGDYIIDCGQPHYAPQLQIRGGETIITASGSPCGSYGAGYWTSEWDNRDVPDAWDGQAPVAVSPILSHFLDRSGPFHDTYDESSFDPQVTLRYRPTENHSLYAKWARAFKAGGFDTSDRGMPEGGIGTDIGQDQFSFDAEHAENFEVGARGTLLGNRFRYGITLFNQTIKDLQVETAFIDLEQALAGLESTGRIQTNAGKQRTRGVDFDATWLAADDLILKMAGVVQKGEMLDFIGGCTEVEFRNADTNDCWSEEESAALLNLNVGDPGADSLAGLIDRAGQKAPRTPSWKVIFGMDYERPLWFFEDRFKYLFNTKVGVSDGYSEDTLGYSYITSWDTHVNWNMNVGVGTLDNALQLNFWMRNILDARVKYHPELDIEPDGIGGSRSSASDFFRYGLQLGYQF